MNRLFISFVIIILLVACGCSTGGGGPVIPDMSSPDAVNNSQDDSGSSRMLWGMYEVQIDKLSGEVEILPLRGVMFNANIQQFLSPPYSPVHLMSVKILSGSNLGTGDLNLEIGLNHPFAGINYYRGFDVRGIFIADGTQPSDHDSNIRYGCAESNEAYMRNPDGYTRWWNATEFTDPMPLLSYKPGKLGTDPDPSATLNPYKYFADDVAYEGEVADLPPETRGVFSPDGQPHRRNYKIQFPVNGTPSYLFNYAIDASWDAPDPSGDPEYPIDSFPPGAQCQEAYHVTLDTSGTTAWYDGGNSGGSVILELEIFDWQALSNLSGVVGEVAAIWVESPVLTSPINILPLAIVSPGSQTTSSIFEAALSDGDLNLTASGTFSLLGSVESADPTTYQPQLDGGESFIFPDGPLAAYFMGTVNIGGATLDLTITQPNGGEIWGEGTSQEITWTGGAGIDNVTLQYSKDDFTGDTNTIATDILNSGSFPWDPVPDDPSETVKVRVFESGNPANYDDSDDYFTITGSPFEIIQPNGGEQWVIGNAYDIEWTGGSEAENVMLEYSKDDFVSDVEIVASTPNTGSFNWNPIPDDPSDTVKVRVSDVDNALFFDDSDDYFEITDQCMFSDAPTYDTYEETDVTWSSGYHFMQIDSNRIVANRYYDEGDASFPWLAVYNDSDYSSQVDTFNVPGWSYPNRPWAFEVDSNDRIFFFMANENTTAGSRFNAFHYVDWVWNTDHYEFNESSFTSFDISSFLDSGEDGDDIWLDSNDDLYVLTDEGKVIKFDHTDSYNGTELFDLDGNPEFQSGWQIDFFLAEEVNAFFIYTGYSTENKHRAIQKVSYDGTVLDKDMDIFSGITLSGECGTYTGGIAADGDCRLVVIDGHIMHTPNLVIIRYDYNLGQKAWTGCNLPNLSPPPDFLLFQPGNTIHFDDDGRIRFNDGGWWADGFMQTQLAFFNTPSDW